MVKHESQPKQKPKMKIEICPNPQCPYMRDNGLPFRRKYVEVSDRLCPQCKSPEYHLVVDE